MKHCSVTMNTMMNMKPMHAMRVCSAETKASASRIASLSEAEWADIRVRATLMAHRTDW